MKAPFPLCVDLDGTLLATDCLWESFVYRLKENPFVLLLVPFWLLKGKAHLKSQLAKGVELDVESLPKNARFLAWLKGEVKAGRPAYLVSGSDQVIVSAVAEKFGFFEQAIGSRNGLNLRGQKKAQYLVDRFGFKGFDYAGNDFSDLAVWENSRTSIVVDPVARLLAKVPEQNRVVFCEDKVPILNAFIQAIRPHHWVKNLLIFVPIVTAHAWHQTSTWISVSLAFISFSLCASAVYLVNDLTDLHVDRLHGSKRNRPFASGALPLYYGFISAPILLVFSLLILAVGNNVSELAVVGVYFLTACLYSFWVKQVAVADIVFLTGFYVLRPFLGAVVIQFEPSEWLVAFAVFFCLNLVLAKRFSELTVTQGVKKREMAGSKYKPLNFRVVKVLGVISASFSILLLAFYISDDRVRSLYEHPQWIWLMCPILVIWVTRFWVMTLRGKRDEDPILFLIRDAFSYGMIAAMVLVGILAQPI